MSFAPFTAPWIESTSGFSEERPSIAGNFRGERLLVPLLTPSVPATTDQVKVAATLARSKDASVRFVDPLQAPERTPGRWLNGGVHEDDRSLLEWAIDEGVLSAPHESGRVTYRRRHVDAVLRAVSACDIDTVVLPRTPSNGVLRQNVNERISSQAECDVVVVNGRPGYETVPSILLPIAGGPHSGLAADVAEAVAAESDAWIDVLHVVEENPSSDREEQARAFVDAAHQRIARPETTTTWILEADDTAAAIVDQSQYYDLTVLGAPTVGKLHRLVYGSTNRQVRSGAESTVLSVCSNRDPSVLVAPDE